MILLEEVIRDVGSLSHPASLSREVTCVSADSRAVGPGAIFVAVKGGTSDGHDFLDAAEAAGALALVGERPPPTALKAPYLRVADSRRALALLAANFHKHPSRHMLVVGVTGTSGKTTTSYLIESILREAGQRVGLLGTVNYRFEGRVFSAAHTTPGPVELQSILAEMRSSGCTAVVMEVSSHALKQHRVLGVAFDAMVFTNLTPEHLDYHPDMEDYFRSKSLLFTEYAEDAKRAGKRPVAAVNVGAEYGTRLAGTLDRVITFGLHSGVVSGAELQFGVQGVSGRAAGLELRSPLVGRFNAENVLAAVAVAQGLGLDSGAITRGVESLRSVPGRLERVPNERGIHVLVDYAHKPDALEKVLETLAGLKGSGRLITVFGCGGDRDRTKRPIMGGLAARWSNQVYVTSDNPRNEDPAVIIREIQAGIPPGATHVAVDADRRSAIFAAIAFAQAGDLVLIAGKGHEDYQILGTRKIHFDDREVALDALSRS